MTATLLVPAALRSYAGGGRQVSVEGDTLKHVLDDLGRRLPALERRLRDERGQLRPHVLVFVDGAMVRPAGDLEVPVRDGAEVYVAPAVSGGLDSDQPLLA